MKKFPRWTLLLAFAFLGLMALRYHLTETAMSSATDCRGFCQTWFTLLQDSALLGGLLALVGLCAFLAKPLRVPLGIIALAVVLLFSVDLFVFQFLNMRLNISDILKYSGDVKISQAVVAPKLFSIFTVLLVSLTVLAIVAVFKAMANAERGRAVAWILIAAIAIGSVRWAPVKLNYISRNIYDDYISNNLPSGVDAPYSPEEKQKFAQSPAPERMCTQPTHAPRPVIVLVVESLSLYHSKKLSGLPGDMPELDKVIDRYAHLQRFYANGFTTDGGMISLLTGRPPLPSINRYSSMSVYNGYTHSEQDFFGQLAEHRIPALYFTSATLDFLNTGHWLKELGFSRINGPTDPFYANMPRGPFDDPGDKAFYRRFLQWYDKERKDGPFFMLMKTTTTHPPFIVAGTDQHGEEAAFRYADEAVGEFIRSLEERHYFDNGLMIIMGDHRSMTVERPGEAQAVGPDAMARIPGIMLGREFRGVGEIPGQWQQTDLIPSALSALGLPSCTSSFEGRFFDPMVQPRVVLHAEGTDRDRVMVKFKDDDQLAWVQLDGGKTRWLSSGRNTPDNEPILEFINRQRSALPVADANLTGTILQIRGMLKPAP